MARPRVVWNVELIVADMAIRAMTDHDLAERAGVATKTVNRFLSGHPQTAKTAGKLATALGFTIKRYLKRVEAA